MIDNMQNEITLQYLSTEASTRRAQSYLPINAAEVSTTNTSESLLSKGKSLPQASSLSEVSPLTNEPHSIDTASAKSSEPSTGMSDSSSRPPSTSLPPLYSEAVSSGATRVNSEDDMEDDSGSDSETNNTALEREVEALYNLWRQMPDSAEEQSQGLGVNSSLLDKLRGIMTSALLFRQKP